MIKNIGLILQTIGYLILGWNIILNSIRSFFNFDWKEIPILIKIVCWFMGIRNGNQYLELFRQKEALRPDTFGIKQRIILYLPLIAVALIIAGVFLNLKSF